MKIPTIFALALVFLLVSPLAWAQANNKIVHDAEYYILEAQNGEKWTAEDKEVDKKLADLQKKYGGPATSSMRPTFSPRLPGWPAPPSTFPPIASSTASTRQPC